jgi:hypothetical protein
MRRISTIQSLGRIIPSLMPTTNKRVQPKTKHPLAKPAGTSTNLDCLPSGWLGFLLPNLADHPFVSRAMPANRRCLLGDSN